MRGSIKQRFKGTWTIRIDAGHELDQKTGLLKRKQKTFSVRGTKQDAEKKLRSLLSALDAGTFVEPSKITLGAWLKDWLESSLKPRVRPSTYVRYKGIVENYLLKAPLAAIPLQKLRPSHVEGYYASAAASASTLTLHHAILHRALRKAVKDG